MPPKTPPKPAPEKSRGGRAKPIAELVSDVGGQAFKRFGFTHSALNDRWAEIVGPQFARHSRPLRLPLAVAATGALAPMLRHVEAQII